MTVLAKHNQSICITKYDLRANSSSKDNTLNGQIKYALKTKKLFKLKNGLYIANVTYLHEPDKTKLAEYLSGQIYDPSYISLEYVLQKHGLLPPQSEIPITSITTKHSRSFQNLTGTYLYANIKSSLFTGFEERTFHDHTYQIATKGKALFDYLYLNSNLARRNDKHLRHQLFEESGIRWNNFSEEDFKEFDHYVWKINSAKMEKIWHILNEHFEKKKFDVWAKELLN